MREAEDITKATYSAIVLQIGLDAPQDRRHENKSMSRERMPSGFVTAISGDEDVSATYS
jgi:hypothetical protein